jgi:hypothetical protein
LWGADARRGRGLAGAESHAAAGRHQEAQHQRGARPAVAVAAVAHGVEHELGGGGRHAVERGLVALACLARRARESAALPSSPPLAALHAKCLHPRPKVLSRKACLARVLPCSACVRRLGTGARGELE